jgi:hypothetical protein
MRRALLRSLLVHSGECRALLTDSVIFTHSRLRRRRSLLSWAVYCNFSNELHPPLLASFPPLEECISRVYLLTADRSRLCYHHVVQGGAA